MTKKDKYLVALDVGSTKTCAILSEVDDSGAAKFVSMGAAESKGLRKGLIANLGATATSIRRAIEEAEGLAGVPVERAIVGVAGSHIRGVNSRGGITLGHRARDIDREDIRRAVDAARNVTLPEDRVILHVLPQELSCTCFHRNFFSMRKTTFATRCPWWASASKSTSIW